MSRYSKNARKAVKPSLRDALYLNVENGYNVFQRDDMSYSAIKADDRKDRADGFGCVSDLVNWINAHAAV